jgi:hypothetical protein
MEKEKKRDLETRLLKVAAEHKVRYTEIYVPLCRLKSECPAYSWQYLVECTEKYYGRPKKVQQALYQKSR